MWTGTQGHRDVHAREQQAYPSQSERLALVGLARQWPGLRTIHGHWKDSLIMGSNRSAIGTLAE